MRGIPSLITDIRKKVFTEVARMAYAGNGYEAPTICPTLSSPATGPCTVNPYSWSVPLPVSVSDWPWD